MADKPTLPGFIQVAAEGPGKRMRMLVDSVQQPDGSFVDVYTEIVAPPPEWQESEQQKYMRTIAEQSLIALQQIVTLLAVSNGRTSPYEDKI